MKLVKLINALPQSAPGNREMHFGQMCEIRGDGIYCEIEDGLADLFVVSNRAKIVEEVKAVEVKAVELVGYVEIGSIDTVKAVLDILQETESEIVAEVSTTVADLATEQGVDLGFGSYQEETPAVTPEPETITSKTTGKRGPKAKNV